MTWIAMRRTLPALSAIFFTLAAPVLAEDRVTLGYGWLLTNDSIADFYDRWHTASGVVSALRGPEGTTGRPADFGEVVELRFGGGILSPSSITNPLPNDRRYAGYLSLGVHSHFAPGMIEASMGVDLVATGPQTGLDGVQTAIHDLLGLNPPSPAVLANQIPDGLYPTIIAELARPVEMSPAVTLRPFVEAQAGVESHIRVGGDVLIGPAWQTGISLRDTTTGLVYQAAADTPATGLSLLVGADVAHVFNSVYLPQTDGYVLTPVRTRARAGVHWQGERAGLFYGLTWLGPEFETQPSGQLVGSIRVDLEF